MNFEATYAGIAEPVPAGITYPMTVAGGVTLAKHPETMSAHAGTYAEVGTLTSYQSMGETDGQVYEAVAICGTVMIGLMGALLCATYFTGNRQR